MTITLASSLLSLAFMTGLLGSGHCLGMCGGLVAACAMTAGRGPAGIFFQLSYHAGRLCTYAVIGAVVGALGSTLAVTEASGVTRVILIASDLFVIVVGVASTRLLPLPNFLDSGHAGTSGLFAAAVRHLGALPPQLRGFPLGLLLGWLPCGFVYALALTAAQSGTAVLGALTMFAFGLGTVPALFLFGSTAQWFSNNVRVALLRVAGGLVAAMGVIHLFRHVKMIGGH